MKRGLIVVAHLLLISGLFYLVNSRFIRFYFVVFLCQGAQEVKSYDMV